MTRHTFVFSDFHLLPQRSPEDAGDPAWMKYRSRRFFVDRDFAALAERLIEETGGAPFEVIFNGDTFELDGADAYDGRGGLPDEDVGNEAREASAMASILDDHPGFVGAVGRLLRHARRVVFVTGNHDIGLYWPRVRETLRGRLLDAALADDPDAPVPPAATLAPRLVFHQWFCRSEDGVYAEHGHQFDATSSSPHPLVYRRGDGRGLWLSFGSLCYRHLLGGLGTINPYAQESFVLGFFGYIRHYLRYYLRKGRPMARTWLGGSLRTTRHLYGLRRGASAPPGELIEHAESAQTASSSLTPEQLAELRHFHAPPLSERPYAAIRELWLDRLGGALLAGALALAAWLLVAWPLGPPLAVLPVLGFVLYARFAPASDLAGHEEQLPSTADHIARTTGANVVLLGHTHRPGAVSLPNGARLVNTGTWAPGFADPECTASVFPARTFAWVTCADGTSASAQLVAWERGEILPFVGARPTAEVRVSATHEPAEEQAA